MLVIALLLSEVSEVAGSAAKIVDARFSYELGKALERVSEYWVSKIPMDIFVKRDACLNYFG